MLIERILRTALAAALLSWGAQVRADDYENLGLADLSSSSEHCWIPISGGRIGIATGTVDALVAETNRNEFTRGGIEPSIGKRIYARVSYHRPEAALIAGIDGDKITVAMPMSVAGYLFLEPFMPIGLYSTEYRQPAITPRIWTDGVTRPKLITMMECFDRLQGD